MPGWRGGTTAHLIHAETSLSDNFISLSASRLLWLQKYKFISILTNTCCELLSNFVSLTDCKQPDSDKCHVFFSCELLSNFVSLTDCKQRYKFQAGGVGVVNCFQTLYLWRTANSVMQIWRTTLLVVNCFQTLYLWRTANSLGTRIIESRFVVNCFQTLYLWRTANSFQEFMNGDIEVVNCFQTLYLWRTANSNCNSCTIVI